MYCILSRVISSKTTLPPVVLARQGPVKNQGFDPLLQLPPSAVLYFRAKARRILCSGLFFEQELCGSETTVIFKVF
jgi:hypothetical protein